MIELPFGLGHNLTTTIIHKRSKFKGASFTNMDLLA